MLHKDAGILIPFPNLSFVWRTHVVVLDFASSIKHDCIRFAVTLNVSRVTNCGAN